MHPSPDAARVTVLGGGTGSFHVLTGLRECPSIYIQSIVSMMDSGGDSGRLRDEYGVLPPGDVRRCLVALAEESEMLRDLFEFRFDKASLKGRSFGNLFLLALTNTLGSERAAIDGISRLLKIRGRVLPVTWDHSHIFAELADGTVVGGEANIDVPKHDPSIPISNVYLQPPAEPNTEVLEAIETSDFLVFAPGDLYTSTIPNLLVEGIPDAIAAATAPMIYVVNLMTKHGETNGLTASQHVERLAEYAKRMPDAVIVHDGEIPAELAIKYFESDKSEPVLCDIERLEHLGVRLIRAANVMSSVSFVRHDPKRIAGLLESVFEELMPGYGSGRQPAGIVN